jgi:Ig-like domain CHU_C associated
VIYVFLYVRYFPVGLITIKTDTLCTAGTANLTVLSNGSFNWFGQSTGGTVLKSGKNVQFAVSTSKTYYVEDASGVSSLVGLAKPTIANNMALKDDRFDRKLKFTVLAKLKVDSISVWSNTATSVTVRILSSDNVTEVFTKTFTGIQLEKESRLFLGKELLPGDYFMDFVGTNGKLYYSTEIDLKVVYPFTAPNLLSITGADPAWVTAKPYYMFAYNWRITAGNTCDRTPVAAVVDAQSPKCNVTGINPNKQEMQIGAYPNPFSDGFLLPDLEGSKLLVFDMRGQLVLEDYVVANQTYGQNLSKGTYVVQVIGLEEENNMYKVVKD